MLPELKFFPKLLAACPIQIDDVPLPLGYRA
jgi:hypothetical protein